METTLVRAFVLMLAVTGFGASAVTAGHAKASGPKAQAQTTGGPMALCAPNDPTYCGMH